MQHCCRLGPAVCGRYWHSWRCVTRQVQQHIGLPVKRQQPTLLMPAAQLASMLYLQVKRQQPESICAGSIVMARDKKGQRKKCPKNKEGHKTAPWGEQAACTHNLCSRQQRRYFHAPSAVLQLERFGHHACKPGTQKLQTQVHATPVAARQQARASQCLTARRKREV